MVEVRMKTLKAGPDGVVQPGKTVPVTDKEADELVSGGYAEYVQAPETAATGKDDTPAASAAPATTGRRSKGAK